MAKRDYKLVSADSHLGLPPGFFQTYLPEQYRDHDWVRMIEAGTKQSLKMAGMGLGHMAGKRYEDFKEKDITEDDIRVGEFEPTARLKDMDLDGVDAEVLISGGAVPTRRGHRRRLPAGGDPVLQQLPLGVLPGRPRTPHRPGDGAVRQPRAGAGGDEAGVEAARHPRLPVRRLPGRELLGRDVRAVLAGGRRPGYPIHFHIGAPRSNAFTMGSLAPNQQGTAMSFISLSPLGLAETLAIILFAGVLERYPNIKFVFTEAGVSWLIYYRDRADDVFRKHRFWTKSELKEKPSFYIDRQVVNTFIHEDAAIRLRHEVGMENMMWSTDYPHSDSTWPHSWKYINEAFVGVPDDERAQLLAGNAIKNYRL